MTIIMHIMRIIWQLRCWLRGQHAFFKAKHHRDGIIALVEVYECSECGYLMGLEK